jgi:probable rRNA maturation factor
MGGPRSCFARHASNVPVNAAMLSIEIADEQSTLRVDCERLKQAAAGVLREAGVEAGALSIAIVDDAAIHVLNRQYLAHDYPTDVLSFLLERDGSRLEGEVVVSAETAARAAAEFGWSPGDELLLYVVHGTLHLVGYDDANDEARATMRAAERRHLAACGIEARGRDDQSGHD